MQGTPEEPIMPESPQGPIQQPSQPGGVKSSRVIRDDGEHIETTIETDLPDFVKEKLKQHDLKLKFHDPEIAKILRDQSEGMVSTDGCISSPGGPSC